MWKTIVLLLCIVTSLAKKPSVTVPKSTYEDYKVFKIVPKTDEQLELLRSLKYTDNRFSFWKGPSLVDREVLIMVAPHQLPQFYEIMDKIADAPYEPLINNIQKLIDDTMPTNQSQGFDFHSYHTLEEIYNNLDELAKKYPNKVQVVVGGTTWEGRQIKGVKIFHSKLHPGVFIEGGMHAREWIAPATVMYILHQLLTSTNPDVKALADNHNFFIFPILNPDGYQYSFDKNRMWRKTRKPSSDVCIGSDPNMNWDIMWNTTGVSTDPCAENYPGREPFSEVEMKSISEYMRSNIRNFYAYLSFHSFGQELMFPYAYSAAHNYRNDELDRVGSVAKEALRVKYQTRYQTGYVGDIYGLLSGSSIDYVAGVFRKPVVYGYELRDKGQYGFLLPPEQIIPTGEETLDSLVAILNETSLHKYGKNV